MAYASRSLFRAEKNYLAFKLEYLALKRTLTVSKSNKFTVYMDNNPLNLIISSAKRGVMATLGISTHAV